MDGSPEIPTGLFAGRYTIERELGRGATATVYLAHDRDAEGSVAIKVLRPELAASVGAERFLREIKVNERLVHPNIVPVLASGAHDDLLFFVLPHMEGGSLRHLLRREKQLSVERAVDIARAIGAALEYAHAEGLIHRDVKPENILFSGSQACLADFGIAKAIETTIDESTTSTGLIRGTPAYMSPEQASGSKDYDGRSDQYSLACVLYEMIAGVAAFIGPTPEAIIAQRFHHAPRKLHIYRSSVSPGLEAVIERALAIPAADRFSSVAAFADALRDAPRQPTVESATSAPPRRGGRNVAIAAGVVAVALIATTVFDGPQLFGGILGRGDAADTTRVAVMPFEDAAGARSLPAHELLHAGLRRWSGVTIVPLDQTKEVLDGRRVTGAPGVGVARDIAASVHAGRYVVGRVRRTPTGRAVAAELRDAHGTTLYSAELSLPADSAKVDAAFAALADSLLLRGASDGAPPDWPRKSPNFAATQAFISGLAARDQWELPRAESLFTLASTLEPRMARAHVWIAEVALWRNRPSEEWVSAVDRALRDTAQLPPAEKLTARALAALAQGEYPRACDLYQQMVRADDHSFAGWYGLGECRRRDKVVLRDARSRSGWRTRSSYQASVVAYTRAFEIFPATYRGFEAGAFTRLHDLLFTSGRKFWQGATEGTPRQDFFATLSIQRDTVLLIPYERSKVLAGAIVPVAELGAVLRQRLAFHQIALRWAAAFPHSAGAKEALAVSLELRGDPAAFDSLASAEILAADPLQKLRLAAARVVVQVKFAIPDRADLLAAARRSADSVMAAHPTPSDEEAAFLAPLAALSGKCRAAADFLRRSSTPLAFAGVDVPKDITADAKALQADAVLGCDPEGAVGRMDSIARRIAASPIDAKMRPTAEYVLLGATALAAYPKDSAWIRRLAPVGGGFLAAASDRLGGNVQQSRSRLMEMARIRQKALPGATTPDVVVPEAILWLQLNDSAAAIRSLDVALGSVRYSPALAPQAAPDNVARIAMLIRAMALRADLATPADPTIARKWARAVLSLWSDSDPALHGVVSRMKALAR